MTYSSKKDVIGRILETVLKLSRDRSRLDLAEIAENALTTRSQARGILEEYGMRDDKIMLDEDLRIRLVVDSLKLGVDGERISRYLSWREFEGLASSIFSEMGYDSYRDLRFKYLNRWHQIDLLAYDGIIMLIVDCKHWKKPLSPSEERRMTSEQERRIKALSGKLSVLSKKFSETRKIRLIPMILTLYESAEEIVEGQPIVPIGKLRAAADHLRRAYYQLRHEVSEIPKGFGFEEIVELLRRDK